MENINREHPDYIARKAMWKQYKDLYAGGEQLRLNACEYLVRRQKEPAQVYEERLRRVFYENYVGSIVDWYAATLMRREPMLQFEGNDAGAKSFYNLLSDDCDLKGTNLHEFFRQRFVQVMVCGSSFVVVDFPKAGGAAQTRAEEDASGRSRAYLTRIRGGRSNQLELRRDRPVGLGGGPDVVPAAIESDGREVGEGDAVDLLRPRELSDLPQGGRGAGHRADR